MTMSRTLLALLALALVLAACEDEPTESAVLGAAPPVRVTVGPIPGPHRVQPGEERTNPYAGNPVALQEGRQLFVWYNCAGCHGGRGGGGMGPSLRDPDWRYGSSDVHIFDSIAEGRSFGMPAWGTMLPEEQIWKLVAYIDSLGTPYEPKPPHVVPPKVSIPEKPRGDQVPPPPSKAGAPASSEDASG